MTASTHQDKLFMQRCIELAALGAGWTNPNPMVGAVAVRDGKIIAEGYHTRVGAPHAEIEALSKPKGSLAGATLYVSLEPCNHIGRTGPCTKAIIASGITRVAIPTLDPNPTVSGQGVAALEKAGIKVDIGVCEEQAKLLNEAYFVFHAKKRPFVAVKYAASLDGKIATRSGDSKWITNEEAREYARGLRGQYQAILVGANTVAADDPHLGARSKNARDPLRIILDPKLKTAIKGQVYRDSHVLVVTTDLAESSRVEAFKKANISILSYSGSEIDIATLLTDLATRDIVSVFVEGGGVTITRFLESKSVDRIYGFYSPILIGADGIGFTPSGAISSIKDSLHLASATHKSFGDNFLISGYPQYT